LQYDHDNRGKDRCGKLVFCGASAQRHDHGGHTQRSGAEHVSERESTKPHSALDGRRLYRSNAPAENAGGEKRRWHEHQPWMQVSCDKRQGRPEGDA
jgi:hypothetical protein